MALTSREYLGAFLDGFEFVLMAMEGRLNTGEMDRDLDVADFIADYRTILELHRGNLEDTDLDPEDLPVPLELEELFAADLPQETRN